MSIKNREKAYKKEKSADFSALFVFYFTLRQILPALFPDCIKACASSAF
jgi:hypothetical protein